MDSIVEAVAAKTGLSKSASKEVVMLVVKGLKDKLPGPMATAIDGVLSGDGKEDGGLLGNITKGLGGMLGGGDKK